MSCITYTPTATIYHEIDTTFDLPNKAVKPSYYFVCKVNSLEIKCSKYDYTAYSIWKGKVCYEDNIKSLTEAKKIAEKFFI